MVRCLKSATLVAALATVVLAGCGTSETQESGAGSASSATPEVAAPDTSSSTPDTPGSASPETPTTATGITGSADQAVAALDALGIEHSEPVRRDVGASGAIASFDLTVNGYDAGVNVFRDADSLQRWQELSDSMGGVHVAYGSSALSLNSSDGIANSVEIAPKIAAELDGEARGV